MKYGGIHVRIALLGIMFASLLWGFRELIFTQLPFIFRNPQEDMSFGWYVPLFSLYVVWVERRKIAESIGRPSILGLLLTLLFLFLGFVGVRGIQVRFGVVAFAGLCLAMPWAVFGRETAKRVLFPCLFLLFCIPLANFLDVITVHLRLLACSVAYAVLKGFGTDVVRQGTMIASASGSFAIDVAEPCSGLRSIFALMALTAGYSYFNKATCTWLRRGVLFALSVPLAVFGNVMRILTICLVASFASGEFATGFYHDYSGYVVFFVAILLMVASGEMIGRIADGMCARRNRCACTSEAVPVASCSHTAGIAIPILCALLVLPMMYFQSIVPEAVVCEAPDIHLVELDGFKSEERPMSEGEKTILPADTRIEKRLYSSEDGQWFLVSVVVGGRHKASIHRPELCLPAQGFLMTNPRTVQVGDDVWRFMNLESGMSRSPLGFAYTFFNQDGFHTASHVRRIFRDVWDRSMYNRIDRWVMITVNSSTCNEKELTSFLETLKSKVGSK